MQTRLLGRGISNPALIFLLGLLMVTPASAQIMVDFKLAKTNHLMGEHVIGHITVYNRAGRDVVLDGPGDQSWLAINVTNPDGRIVTTTAKRAQEKPVVLREGQALKRDVIVNDFVNFDDYGNYGVTASVFYPEKRNYFASERKRVDISDGQIFWEQIVGIPDGQPDAGRYRKFQLLTYNSTQRTELYARIRDDTGHFEYGTLNLGTIILYRDPQVTVDGDSRLNLLFMAAPRTYRHIIISPNGQIISQKIYNEDGGNRPRLLVSESGVVNVRGGVYQDPERFKIRPGEQGSPIRSISERKIPGQ